ncbi:hypothetical protein, partial [Micromonospora wenchangensis]|uniref:hypothetical protein n=1 Tax=Micromonospora wenchangensis TaxID=1185415 RepID=UPI003D7546DB
YPSNRDLPGVRQVPIHADRRLMHFHNFPLPVVIPTVATASASLWENMTDGRTGERETVIVGSGPGGRKR